MITNDVDDDSALLVRRQPELVAQVELQDDSKFSPNCNFFVSPDDGKLSVWRLKGDVSKEKPVWSRSDLGKYPFSGLAMTTRF